MPSYNIFVVKGVPAGSVSRQLPAKGVAATVVDFIAAIGWETSMCP
jgi:hypothetical protein